MSIAREMICCSSSFVSWVDVIVKPVGRCVACDIHYSTLWDTRTFQLLCQDFSRAMVGQILLGTQTFQPRWVVFHVFHDCVYGVLSYWDFLVPNAWNQLVNDIEVNRPLFFISLGRFPRYRLNNMTGHSFPVANILRMTNLAFTLSPPCLVLVGPSAKVRNSFPSSSRCKSKIFNFHLVLFLSPS